MIFDIFKYLIQTSVCIDFPNKSELLEMLDNWNRVTIMSDKSCFENVDRVALSPSSKTSLNTSFFLAVKEEDKVDL